MTREISLLVGISELKKKGLKFPLRARLINFQKRNYRENSIYNHLNLKTTPLCNNRNSCSPEDYDYPINESKKVEI